MGIMKEAFRGRTRRTGAIRLRQFGVASLSVCAVAAYGLAPTAGAKTAKAAGGSVNVGVATTLSGPFAALGRPGMLGIKLAIAQIDKSGGLLGQKLNFLTADDQIDPDTGATVTRNLILNKHVKVLFGSVSSAVGLAQSELATRYKVPLFLHMANDISLTTSHYSPETYVIGPNTDMEPAAVARAYVHFFGKGPVRIATITPDYSFGLDTVSAFLKDMKSYGVKFTVVDQQTPQLGATSYTTNISAVLASNPQFVFIGEYGADLVTLTKQGVGLGLFKHAKAAGMYGSDVVQDLGKTMPAGILAWDRAASWAHNIPAMTQFMSLYKRAYGTYPDEWATNGYDAALIWAYGVKKAGSFSAAAISKTLSGATVPTAIGNITIRACDHQSETVDDTGLVSSTVNKKYGIPLWSKTFIPSVSQVIDPCHAS